MFYLPKLSKNMYFWPRFGIELCLISENALAGIATSVYDNLEFKSKILKTMTKNKKMSKLSKNTFSLFLAID